MVYLRPHDLSEIYNAVNIYYLLFSSQQYQACENTESPCFQKALQHETLFSCLFQTS